MRRRVGSGAVQRHADGISFFVEGEVIDEFFDEEESATGRPFDAIGRRRIGNTIRIEPLPLVLDVHLDPTIEFAQRDVHLFLRIEPITVDNRVRQGLRQRDAEIEANRLDGQTARQAVPRYDLDGLLDNIQLTRNGDEHQDRCIGSQWMRRVRAPHTEAERNHRHIRNYRGPRRLYHRS